MIRRSSPEVISIMRRATPLFWNLPFPHPPAIRIAVAMIGLLPAWALAGEPSPKPSLPASQIEVPAALLVRLRAQYIPEETKTPGISDNDNAPGVNEFLEAEGINPFPGRLMNAKLLRLDGSVLTLPRDTLGKFTVIHFWSMAKSGLVERTAKGVVSLWPQYKPFRDAGVEFVGVNLDMDHARVARFIRDECEGVDWPQTCSGLGLNDPTFRQYRIQTLPAYLLIGPDGRVISDNYHGGVQPWSQFGNAVRDFMGQIRETAIRMPHYRSGEFLLLPSPVLGRGAGGEGSTDIPAEQLNELHRKVLLPPALGPSKDQKAAALREALELGRTIKKKYPRAVNLPVVWNAMLVAARWLAMETPDQSLAKQAQEIAARILESKAEGPSRLLADYVQASGELAAGEFSRQESARRIDEFVKNLPAFPSGASGWDRRQPAKGNSTTRYPSDTGTSPNRSTWASIT